MAQPEHPYPERDELIREHVPCPDCTAGRGEPCRDVDGAEVPTHERRVSVYIRDFVEPFISDATERPAEEPPALGRIEARARGRVTKKADVEDEQQEGDRG